MEGDVNVVLGDVTIEGIVDGNVNVLGGNIFNHGRITGQKNAVGGDVPAAVVPWARARMHDGVFRPSIPPVAHRLGLSCGRILPHFSATLADRTGPARAHRLLHAVGLLGRVAVIPISLLLLLSLILIPLIPPDSSCRGCPVPWSGGTRAAGWTTAYEQLKPKATPTPLVALVAGLVL